jgi:hypothetical protein
MCLWILLSICASTVFGEKLNKPTNMRIVEKKSIISSGNRTKIIPWIEVNSLDAQWVEPAIQGLEIWQKITDTAIVSTVPGNAVLYEKLRKRLPGMQIIPGVKTWTLLQHDFDSLEGWIKVAQEVRAVAEISGQHVVLLENETAIMPVMEGKQLINLELLKHGLESLPQDIELIWYPGINGKNIEEQDRTAAVCNLIRAVCKVYFTDLRYMGQLTYTTARWKRAGETYDIIAPQSVIPMLYFLGNVSYYWQDNQIVEVLEKYDLKGWVIVYTGFSRWKEAAQNMLTFKDKLSHSI